MRCFQFLPVRIRPIMFPLTPYSFAILPLVGTPLGRDPRPGLIQPYFRLISSTCSSVSFAVFTLAPWLCRHFRSWSCLLSAALPRNRWSGLTHGGLSQ